MSAILSGTGAANRLVEVLAGSTALLADPSATVADAAPLSPLMSDGDTVTDAGAGAASPVPIDALLTDVPLHAFGSGESGALGLDDIAGGAGSIGEVGALHDLTGLVNLGEGDGLQTPVVDLAGSGAPLQPVFDAANTAILDVHTELEALGHEIGLPYAVHGVTNLGETVGLGRIGEAPASDGHTNLITDTLNAPDSVLNGDLNGTVAHVGADLSDTINAASALKDSIIFGTGDPTNPVPEIISSLGSDLQHSPLVTINGGNNAGDGGVLGGIAGDLSGSSTGHLVDVDIGPQQSSGGQVLDILAAPEGGPHNTLEINAVDVGANGPHVADLGLLTGASPLSSGNVAGLGTDSLVGNVLGGGGPGSGVLGGSASAGNDAGANAGAGATAVDTGLIHDALSSSQVASDHGALDLHGVHII